MSRYAERRRHGLVTDRRVVLTTVGILAVAGGALLLRPDTSDAAARRSGGRNIVCQPVDGASTSASAQNGQQQNRQQGQQENGQAAQQGDQQQADQQQGDQQQGDQQQADQQQADQQQADQQQAGQQAGQQQRTGRNGCPPGTRAVFVNVGNTQGAGQSTGNNDQNNNQNGGQGGGRKNNVNQGGQNGGVGAEPTPAEGTNPAETTTPGTNQIVNPTSTQAPQGQQQNNDGRTPPANQDILGNNCNNSRLQPHDGFQNGNRCVSTAFGEVANADNNPTLLITSAPRFVRANQAFDLRVSTRNLVRDRFLAAAQGGYYKESSFLNNAGLTRGHFHSACRMLGDRQNAPDPAPNPAFFAATEDGKGGANPDTVTVRITGLPRGEAQCAVWAGDGSHRVPMMQRANQIPAFDVVRISVR